ncbi:hypothetical protein RIF29_27222 [Crotalaria pallida]|uniref:Trs120/TRAPPC9 N-terminal domain-containing protein n=1 Tax=Crotalaria pallida TaxID=3830 RepID=A0AAN9I5D0_CROPI
MQLKKRRPGRVQKAMGDYCMLAGSPVDANAHYQIALELTKMTGDDLWYAGAMRGSICAMLASGTSEYTGNSATTENCKKKKSEAKLYEEARFLHKERKCLAEEIANQNATLRALRARNERLKRMKESLADEPQQKIVPSRALISATKDDTYQRAEDSKAARTELPDLNMLPSEE